MLLAEWDWIRFGLVWRHRRELLGLNLRQLGRRSGVCFTYIGKIERGELAPPPEDRVMAIGAALGLDQKTIDIESGRISDEILDIIRANPVETIELLRAAQHVSPRRVRHFIQRAHRAQRASIALKTGAATQPPPPHCQTA